MRLLYLNILIFITLLCLGHFHAQTFGPNNPSSGTNTTSIGTFAWSTPSNVLSSNNAYASVTSKGITNYLSATNFGFSLPVSTAINGIQLDIEKSTLSPTVVTVLNNWTSGLTKTVSSGSNRMLLFIASMENGSGARDITALTYGGQAMTQIVEGVTGTSGSFQAKLEFWVLLESGIASATSTAFSPTFASATLTENVELYSSAVYAGVDQILPYTTTQVFTTTSTTSTVTVSPALATTGGGMAVAAIHCGNNTTPNSSMGGTNTFSISSTFTETIDTYTGCACSASLSGMSTQIAHQTISTSGTVAPSYTFAGTPNRRVVVYVNLTCVNELDNSVRLIKGGVLTGSNLAYTTSPWNTVDTYTSYGDASTLWGTTWSVSEVNASDFGAAISASVNNGTARVDHMRITITGTSTLPVELLDFYGEKKDNKHYLRWQTASERQNKHFEIERSDGLDDFIRIGVVPGQINSKIFKSYSFEDDTPLDGIVYYRLKQVDVDGAGRYSSVIAVMPGNESQGRAVVYPNPSCDGHFALITEDILEGLVYVYSSEMKLVLRTPTSGNLFNLKLEELTDGEYYHVFNTGGQQKIKKLIKQCR